MRRVVDTSGSNEVIKLYCTLRLINVEISGNDNFHSTHPMANETEGMHVTLLYNN